MIPSLPAVELAKKYLPKILAVAVVFLGLLYLHHEIDKGGYNRAVAECQKKELEADRKAAEYLKLKNHEVRLKDEVKHKQSIGAIEEYAKYADDLRNNLTIRERELERLQHSARKSTGSRDPVRVESKDSCQPTRTGEEAIQNALSIKAVELLIEKYLVPNGEIVNALE